MIGAAGMLLVIMVIVARGHADRPHRAGRLLEAARCGPHVRARAADVHHRRRRPPGRAADGDHAPVRLLRRLVDRRQLRHARPPAARLEPGDGHRGGPGEPADHPRRGPRAGPARGADRGDDVLADVGAAGARRAPGQRDPARGPVRDQARADPVPVARPRPQQGAARRRPHVLLPSLPAGTARRARRRLLDRGRSRTGLERSLNPTPDRIGPEPLLARRPVARQAERQADRRRHGRDDAGRQRPAHRARRTRQQLRRRRRARSANGPGARDGLVAELQPERRRGATSAGSSGSAPTARLRRRSSTAPARGSTRRARRSRS